MATLSPSALWGVYQLAEESYDIMGRADCVRLMLALAQDDAALETTPAGAELASRVRIVLLAALDALARGDGRVAEDYLALLDERVLAEPAWLPMQYFYKSWARYLLGDRAGAGELLRRHLTRYPADRLARAALGSLQQGGTASYLLGDSVEAAIERPFDIPIFINHRDRVTCLQGLVDWLLAAGYRRIYILDNDSSYAELLDYYQTLPARGVRVIRLGRNVGHRALWDSGVLDLLNIRTPYVYTDSDVVPVAECPADFVSRLGQVLGDYPYLYKVGSAIVTEDVTCSLLDGVADYARRVFALPLAGDVYYADVDTTLALYRNIRHYTRGPAAQVGGRYMIRHLPWYYDYDSLPPDEAYYMEHASYSSSIKAIREGLI